MAVQHYQPVCWVKFGGVKELGHLDVELEKVGFRELTENCITSDSQMVWAFLLGTVGNCDSQDPTSEPKHIVLLLQVLDPALHIYERVGIVQCPLSGPGFLVAGIESVIII
jgi:hypothetical protein